MFSHHEYTKITQVWFHADSNQFMQSQLDYVDSVQHYLGSIFYTNEKVAEFLDDKNSMILLKYEIPEAEQEKITQLYYQAKRMNFTHRGVKDVFCATSSVLPIEIINFDYYVGYCKYSSDNNTYEFYPCDPVSKKRWLNEQESESSIVCQLF